MALDARLQPSLLARPPRAYGSIAVSHQARISAKRRSESEPKSGSRVSRALVVAGLVMPARNRACCLGIPSASGLPSRRAATASALTDLSIGGIGCTGGSVPARPVRQYVQCPQGLLLVSP